MLEGYEVLRKVSEGAAAEVYLARPSNGSDHVIAEVMRPDLVQEPALVARFLAEAKARQAITHPNIAHRVHTGATADGRPWLVSEPVGESLASRLNSRGALPLEVLLPIALQVCEGLEFMHQAGMVHGNLKPATVYVVERDGALSRVKLIDFGLSFLRPGRTLPRPPGVILVEPEYLAPERVRGQRCTPLADVYGAGVLFYELLTGFPPFTGADSSVVRRRQLEETPAPLPESCALLTPIVERCLAKDPAARYPSVGALKTALKELAEKALSTPIDIELSLEPGPAPAVPPASVVGSYELLQPLGEGAMGRVFLARHQTLDRRVALKILKPELAQSRNEVERFIQEAQAVNKIRHEHIVEIYDCVDETLTGGERRVYFVMELLQGQSLRERLCNGPLPLPRALRLMRQVALALDAVHRVGVVHRDVKPDNIFITTKNGADFVKVLDFGVAKLRDQGVETSNGAPVVVGTPRYMAPEQLLGQKTDPRADIYGLGILLYRLICGQPPFSGTTFEQLVKAIVRETPAPLPARTQRDEPVPPALRALISACLEKDPERRPQTMAEVGTALEGLLTDETTPPGPAGIRRKRSLALPLLAGGLALSLALAVAALVTRTPAAAPARPVAAEPGLVVPTAPVAAPGPTPTPTPTPTPAAVAEKPASALVIIAVASQPPLARVLRADTGEVLGVTPLDVAVPPEGELTIKLTRDGYLPATARLKADSASPTVVKMRKRTKGGKGVNRDDVIDPFGR
ncbi:MAG TPA: serine/threonine-protein kinase [Myxococcales bacterium]|jgi:serine/threonine-protein kinase